MRDVMHTIFVTPRLDVGWCLFSSRHRPLTSALFILRTLYRCLRGTFTGWKTIPASSPACCIGPSSNPWKTPTTTTTGAPPPRPWRPARRRPPVRRRRPRLPRRRAGAGRWVPATVTEKCDRALVRMQGDVQSVHIRFCNKITRKTIREQTARHHVTSRNGVHVLRWCAAASAALYGISTPPPPFTPSAKPSPLASSSTPSSSHNRMNCAVCDLICTNTA